MSSTTMPSPDQLRAAADALEFTKGVDLSEVQRRFTELCESLPVAGLVPAGIGMLVGLMLWRYGERFLRLALMVMGIFVGVPLGMALAAAFAPALPPVAAAIVGGVSLMVIGAIGLRFAVAGGLAVLLGLAGVLGTTVAIERGWIDLKDAPASAWAPAPIERASFRQTFDSAEPPAMPPLLALQAPPAEGAAEQGSQWMEIRRSLELGQAWLKERWAALPPAGRTLVAASGGVGMLLGFGFGMILRRQALQLASALLGSLLILSGGTTLLAWAFPEWAATRLPGGLWLGLWGVLAIAGAMLQWKRQAVRADNG